LNARFNDPLVPRSEFFTDGIHFSEISYRLWTEELARAFQPGG
jgi:lysophospholipase L1-like esterase